MDAIEIIFVEMEDDASSAYTACKQLSSWVIKTFTYCQINYN